MKVALGYSGSWQKTQETGEQREAERYHTYGSLLYRLSEFLNANSLLKKLDGTDETWQTVQSSDFVEIRGVFRPNPIANSLQVFDRVVKITQLSGSITSSTNASKEEQSKRQLTAEEKERAREAKRRTEETLEKQKSMIKNMEQLSKFLQGILSDIQSENIRVFVIDILHSSEYKAVVLLYLDYLRDQTMTEISQKEYRLLGKVVRKLEKNNGEPIDLLLGTGLGGMNKEMLGKLVNTFSEIPGMNLPVIQTEIQGPALEIIPIAVYV